MERIKHFIQPPLGICEQPQCSINATNLCQTHKKKVWDTCSVIFHYDWKLKIKMKNCEKYMHAAVEAIEYIIAKI